MYYIDNTTSNISLAFFKELCKIINIIPNYEREQDIRGGLFLIDTKENTISQINFDKNNNMAYSFVMESLADKGVTNLTTYYIVGKLPACDIPVLPSLYKLHQEVVKYVPIRPFINYCIRPIVSHNQRDIANKSWTIDMIDTRKEKGLFWFADIKTCELFYSMYKNDFNSVTF